MEKSSLSRLRCPDELLQRQGVIGQFVKGCGELSIGYILAEAVIQVRTERLTSSGELASNPEDELSEVLECLFKPLNPLLVSRGPYKVRSRSEG